MDRAALAGLYIVIALLVWRMAYLEKRSTVLFKAMEGLLSLCKSHTATIEHINGSIEQITSILKRGST